MIRNLFWINKSSLYHAFFQYFFLCEEGQGTISSQCSSTPVILTDGCYVRTGFSWDYCCNCCCDCTPHPCLFPLNYGPYSYYPTISHAMIPHLFCVCNFLLWTWPTSAKTRTCPVFLWFPKSLAVSSRQGVQSFDLESTHCIVRRKTFKSQCGFTEVIPSCFEVTGAPVIWGTTPQDRRKDPIIEADPQSGQCCNQLKRINSEFKKMMGKMMNDENYKAQSEVIKKLAMSIP